MENNKELINKYEILLKEIKREGIDSLKKFLYENNFFNSPASTRHHGNYDGGLAEHSLNILSLFEELCIKFNITEKDIPKESRIICALFHDLCKIKLYDRSDIGYCWNKEEGKLNKIYKHAGYSIYLLEKHIKLTEQEKKIIKFHMGMYSLPCSYDENTESQLFEAFNDKIVKLFYFCDDMCSQFLDKKV